MSNIQDAMKLTMEKLREMVDVNTVVGQPITTPDGTSLIPVSKVTFGFASGGPTCAMARERARASPSRRWPLSW